MAFVAINVLEVPPQMRTTLEERFAGRAGEVEKMEGFQSFELLRPIPAEQGSDQSLDRYLVYTRWDSKESFEAWVNSQAFSRGHAQHAAGGPAATGSQVWMFEVALAAEASQAPLQ